MEVSGGRLWLGWLDGVKMALGNRGMTGGCVSIHQRSGVEIPGTCVTE